MRLALYQPDIPQNTGTILRLAACVGVGVDVIGPAGFDLTDRALKRAGLDYIDHATLCRHESWSSFCDDHRARMPTPRLVLLSSRASQSYLEFRFAPSDVLLFGRESSGVPDHVHRAADACITIPIVPGLRSLNLAIAAAMAVGEALRQTDSFPK